ncbi:hypothetical protein [Budvicia aquatica]|uniref:Uncharacterized protein n=1 Tax=Budvicia aquatica TaxID=82979 RepID=A0A2C6DM04_9GAMM|nr:hypothetical protein [Budvicia aquatica]PHI29485.1 hypothetical protein CRN84_09165 [Budvicia aquatica]VFS47778.1 Uncharacterised protein [Budvicia aquatica]
MKNRPLQAANQVICDSDNTAIHELKPAPKKHRARVYMLRTGINGFTENEILYYCRLSSGRNYASELERRCAIKLERLDEPNPDGIGSHYRYRLTNRSDAMRVINLVNAKASTAGYSTLTSTEISDILSLYPDENVAA